MKIDIRRMERITRLAAVALLASVGVFLATAPWHPRVGDSHGGLMAVFPGALLILFASFIYMVGRFLSRRGKWGPIVQIAVSVFVAFIAALLIFE